MLNISPLPFYENIEDQQHRKAYAFGQIYPLVIFQNSLMPFQICLPALSVPLNIKLVSLQNKKQVDITAALSPAMSVISTTSYKLMRYFGKQAISAIQQEGPYYLELAVRVDGLNKVYYSEIFISTNNLEGRILIEYGNTENLYFKNGVVDFSNDFKFSCYLCTQIGKPKYVFEEEAIDRFGYSFIESQVSKKVYNFTALVPEFLCDALRIVRMCNTCQITDILTNKTYDLIAFEMDTEWQEQGDLAAVNCSFETDTIITNIGGYFPEAPGFNEDFNDDYEKNKTDA